MISDITRTLSLSFIGERPGEMKVLVFVVMLIIYLSKAEDFLSLDEIETYLKKFVLKDLTDKENETLQKLFEILRLPEYMPALARNQHVDYPTAYETDSRIVNLQCLVCRSGVNALFAGVDIGLSDEDLIESISILCVSLGIMSENVCNGAVALNLPIINYIIRNIPEATSRAFCSLVMQTAQADLCPHDDERFDWTVELPAVPETVSIPQIDQRPLKVAILSDAHIDPLYEAYGVADCDEPTCCRKGQNPRVQDISFNDNTLYESVVEINGANFINLSKAIDIRKKRISSLHINDSPVQSAPAGYWGDYRNCDTPIWAFDDVIDRVAAMHRDIDMVYYIGDSIDHGVWETTYGLINEVNLYLIEKMRSAFGEHVPVIPTIGNHESQPTNQFAPNYVVGEHNTTWLYEALANKWDPYLTEEAKESMLVRGDFSLRPRSGLKVISMNNNAAYKYNWWLVFDPLDAKSHLDWLIRELYESELAGEKVHILTHIPPGVHDLTQTWTREYNRIVNRFSSTIAAEFNGHVHSDEFKLFYSSTDGSPINVAWGGGAATAYTEYNLNYKIVDFNNSSFEPENMQCYSYNMTEANLTPNRRPHWFQLYDLNNSFDLPDLTPASINNLVYSMASESNYLDLYSAYFSRLSDARWPRCDQDCKIRNLCNIVITVLWDRRKCEEIISTLGKTS